MAQARSEPYLTICNFNATGLCQSGLMVRQVGQIASCGSRKAALAQVQLTFEVAVNRIADPPALP